MALAVAAGAGLLPAGGPAATASAAAGSAGTGSEYHLSDRLGGPADHVLRYGRVEDQVLVGDWDGDGDQTVGIRRGNRFHLANTLGGPASVAFTYGQASDEVLVGDWDGDGAETIGIRRGNRFHLADALGGAASVAFTYGQASDEVLVGDWDGDGDGTVGIRRGNRFHLADALGRPASVAFTYGQASDEVLVGDWDGDGDGTVGIRRGNRYHLANALGGPADVAFPFGSPSDAVLVGDWDGAGGSTLGVRRHAITIADDAIYSRAELRPGTYRAPGGPECLWIVASDAAVFADDFWPDDPRVKALDMPVGTAFVDIRSDDEFFATQGCGTWVRTSAADVVQPGAPRSGLGRVGKEVASGTFRTGAPAQECYWERLADFRGVHSRVLEDNWDSMATTVTIAPTDRGFYSQACGTWSRTSQAARAGDSTTETRAAGGARESATRDGKTRAALGDAPLRW